MFESDVFMCPPHHTVSVKAFGFRTVRFVKLRSFESGYATAVKVCHGQNAV